MSAESQSSGWNESQSIYAPVIDSVWRDIDEIQNEFKELSWFGAHRFDGEVITLRQRLIDAMAERVVDEDGESFRDFHTMRLLFECVDAIVYAPQLHATTVDRDQLTETFALGLQLGATKALVGVLTDRRGGKDARHREYRAGIINELIPLALLNREPVVSQYGSLVVPASKREDTEEKTDIKSVSISSAESVLPIQVKTRRGSFTSIPLGGVVIYGEDMPRSYKSTADALRNNYSASSSKQRTTLDNQGLWLAKHIETKSTPEERERTEQEVRNLNRDERRKSRWTPAFTHRIGDNPALKELFESMHNPDEVAG